MLLIQFTDGKFFSVSFNGPFSQGNKELARVFDSIAEIEKVRVTMEKLFGPFQIVKF